MMRATIVFIAVFLTAMVLHAQSTIFVHQSATGANNGSSWADAFTDFQDALDASVVGDEIWVAAGTYLPSKDLSGMLTIGRDATFFFDKDLTIRGGFVGNETSLSQRICNNGAVTTLSGDIGTVGNYGDNAYHVCFSRGLSPAFLMDCMTITLGNGYTGPGNQLDGACWYNDANAQISSPSFENCKFTAGNSARGAGFFNDGQNGGEANSTFTDCTFSGNLAEYGGGIYNNGINGNASPNFYNCSFISNKGNHGGGIYNNGENGNANGNLTDCYFYQNRGLYGAGMYNFAKDGNTLGSYLRCTFEKNVARAYGGGSASLAENGNAKGNFVECIFLQNVAKFGGGAAWAKAASPWFHECSFNLNTSSGDGGAIFNDGSQGWSASPRFLLCEFDENTATKGGGAIYSTGLAGDTQGQALFCKFRQNHAENGGATYQDGSAGLARMLYYNCIFSRNTASQTGGAAYLTANSGTCNPFFASCSFYGNTAADGSLLLATQTNGGVAQANGFNIASFGHTGSVVFLVGGAQFTSDHGIYEAGATINCTGTCLPGLDPQYVNPTNDDLDLQPGSPAIDQGNSFWVMPPYTSDIAGNTRVQGSAIDLGAYETPGPPPCPRVIYVNNIATGANDGTSWADAYLDLQDALAEARVNPCTDTILIAEGVYKPHTTNRGIGFELVNDIEIYGGFPNTGNPWFAQRNLILHETILSGDLGVQGDFNDNSYGVLTAGFMAPNFFFIDLNAGTIVDGVTVSQGWTGFLSQITQTNSRLEVQFHDVKFFDNKNPILRGAGVEIGLPLNSPITFTVNPYFERCEFSNNHGYLYGAFSIWGALNVPATCNFKDCLFKDNSAGTAGGACYILRDVSGSFENCIFESNTVTGSYSSNLGGGAICFNNDSQNTSTPFSDHWDIKNCLFNNNSSNISGGTISSVTLNSTSSTFIDFSNCTFNHGRGVTGGLFYLYSATAATINFNNSILWDNDASWNGDIMACGGNSQNNININNCLVDAPSTTAPYFWQTNPIILNFNPSVIFNQNPQFVNAAGGNLRLQAGSPAIDAGDNGFVLPGMTTDIIGNVRIDNGTVDMGCYENFPGMLKQAESSESNELAGELQSQPDFILAPNPAHDQVKLNISSGKAQGGAIFNLMGKQVLQWQGDAELLDIAALPAGVYLVRLQFEGSSVTKRLVKE